MLALGIATAFGNLVGLRTVYATEVREEQQPVVRRRDKEMLNHVIAAQLGSANSLTASFLGAVVISTSALCETIAGDGDDNILFGDEVFHRHFPIEGNDGGATLIAELLNNFAKFFGDDCALTLRLSQDILQIFNAGAQFGVLIQDLLTFQSCQSAQLQGQDCVGLDLINIQQLHQAATCLIDRG